MGLLCMAMLMHCVCTQSRQWKQQVFSIKSVILCKLSEPVEPWAQCMSMRAFETAQGQSCTIAESNNNLPWINEALWTKEKRSSESLYVSPLSSLSKSSIIS